MGQSINLSSYPAIYVSIYLFLASQHVGRRIRVHRINSVPFMENYVLILEANAMIFIFGMTLRGSGEDRLDVKSICISATLHHNGL